MPGPQLERGVVNITVGPLRFDRDNDGLAAKWGVVGVINGQGRSLFANCLNRLGRRWARFIGFRIDKDGEVDKLVGRDTRTVSGRYGRRRTAQSWISQMDCQLEEAMVGTDQARKSTKPLSPAGRKTHRSRW